MNRIKQILMIVLTVSLLSSCDFIKNTFEYKDTTKEFVETLIKEDYDNQKLPAYYEQVCERHDVTRDEFDQAYQWYSHQPELMKGVLQEIEDQLKVEEAEISVDDSLIE